LKLDNEGRSYEGDDPENTCLPLDTADDELKAAIRASGTRHGLDDIESNTLMSRVSLINLPSEGDFFPPGVPGERYESAWSW
jgi:hypothetical protein